MSLNFAGLLIRFNNICVLGSSVHIFFGRYCKKAKLETNYFTILVKFPKQSSVCYEGVHKAPNLYGVVQALKFNMHYYLIFHIKF